MGCICSKGASGHKHDENRRGETVGKSSRRFVSLSKKDDDKAGAGLDESVGGNDAKTRLISEGKVEENDGSFVVVWEGLKKNETVKEKTKRPQPLQRHSTIDVVGKGVGHTKISRVASIPNGVEAERFITGWPSWLTAVAGEAISGWVPRRSDSFEKLEKIGQGTYSTVYRARDLETGKIVAMKKVRFIKMDPESVRFMAREIHILRKLDHPNVMKLECLATSGDPGSLYLIFEYMEHDLAGLAARPGVKFTEAQIKCYMQQLLRGLEHCHSRGVLHRDIKGANLLIDSNGILKIGDFGLSTFVRQNQKQPMTSRVVTLWYRPPELLLGSTNYGVSVDLWSAGCILAELFYRRPIMPGRTEVEQLHKIFRLCGSPSEDYWANLRSVDASSFKPQQPYKRILANTFKDFPPSALGLLDILLAVEPELRGTASLALKSEFFTTKPLPCDPSTFPKYPPSKELDARRQDKEGRRHKPSSGNGLGQELSKRDSHQSVALPAADANTKSRVSAQNQHGESNPKTSREDGGSGVGMEPQGGVTRDDLSHSSQSTSLVSSWSHGKDGGVPNGQGRTSILNQDAELWTKKSYTSQGSSEFSRFASSIEGGLTSQFDKGSESLNWSEKNLDARYRRLGDEISAKKLGWSHQLLNGLNPSGNKEERSSHKASNAGCAPMNRFHCSGPLLPAGVNMEEILEEHEKQIQRAVRKSISDKKARKANSDNARTKFLLHQDKEAR